MFIVLFGTQGVVNVTNIKQVPVCFAACSDLRNLTLEPNIYSHFVTSYYRTLVPTQVKEPQQNYRLVPNHILQSQILETLTSIHIFIHHSFRNYTFTFSILVYIFLQRPILVPQYSFKSLSWRLLPPCKSLRFQMQSSAG